MNSLDRVLNWVENSLNSKLNHNFFFSCFYTFSQRVLKVARALRKTLLCKFKDNTRANTDGYMDFIGIISLWSLLVFKSTTTLILLQANNMQKKGCILAIVKKMRLSGVHECFNLSTNSSHVLVLHVSGQCKKQTNKQINKTFCDNIRHLPARWKEVDQNTKLWSK